MFKIKVIAPITNWNIDSGYFTGCYRAKSSGESYAYTWIGFTNRPEEKHLHKLFKTRKQAENKIEFLKQKQNENGYMWNWKFIIEEANDE